MASSNFAGFDRITRRLLKVAKPTDQDVKPLLEELERIFVEDNRKGVLEGMDRFDRPMTPLSYRNGTGARTRSRSMSSSAFGTLDRLAARAPNTLLLGKHRRYNNLSTPEYQKLTGPRLAPRRTGSRVITNYRTEHGRASSTAWKVTAGWKGIVNEKGEPFLMGHFLGLGMPRYDLRGLRKWGRDKAKRAVSVWARWFVSGR